ncbi:MAG: Rpn family recombination-promoting nuclease/putative transposase, partial [Muribaculaceae bacterium]|nr:Rpn family recombination-promoting nuclease/putative transposase [Muribaculaceae bacterium]
MKTTIEDLLNKTFIKLRSDYGFKRAFGSQQHSEVLKRFLNALFEGKMVVTDVTFQDKEVLPPDADGKRIVYDAYCTTSTGYHFVVEMQRKQSELFGKRMIFYISSCVFRQGESGKSYKFEPIYLIVITDFDMKPFQKRLINEIVLMERNTNVVFTEDFKIFFLSLSQVSEEWEDCKSEIERRLYLIKNMEKLNKNSKPYKTGEYDEMFEASEIASMAAEDIVAYRNSIMIEMERESELEFAKEEGKEEGREEGREEERMIMARRMKANGLPIGDILLYTGLSEEQVRSL